MVVLFIILLLIIGLRGVCDDVDVNWNFKNFSSIVFSNIVFLFCFWVSYYGCIDVIISCRYL